MMHMLGMEFIIQIIYKLLKLLSYENCVRFIYNMFIKWLASSKFILYQFFYYTLLDLIRVPKHL